MSDKEKQFAFQCGSCGMPCNETGEPLGDTAPTAKDGESTKTVYGKCCHQDNECPRFVTREMALDAGDPDLEGWPI